MIVLGIDTSGDRIALGLSRDGKLLEESSKSAQNAYLGSVLPMIDHVLKNFSLDMRDIDLFSVLLGPGSWTGIRIGVTMMKTMAQALDKPVVGLCSLDVLAYNMRFTDHPVYPLVDAARDRVYYAGYDCKGIHPHRFEDYRTENIQDFLDNIKHPAVLLGDGVHKYRKIIESSCRDSIMVVTGETGGTRGACVIEAGPRKFEESGPDDVLSLAPLYLQKSDAERVWDKKDGDKVC